MSVPKYRRSQSQFEVFHHWYETRKKVTETLLYDFGLKPERVKARALHQMGCTSEADMEADQREHYQALLTRLNAFCSWFIREQRRAIMDCMARVTEYIFLANSIYPTLPEELTERRLYQDRAIGHLYRLEQELQYALESMPVDANRYLDMAEMIEKEISLVKGWRKADNKFKVKKV